jgi:hypothetical protein
MAEHEMHRNDDRAEQPPRDSGFYSVAGASELEGVLAIGVTGHRRLDQRELHRIRTDIRNAIAAIATPRTVLVSPIAEGADRIAAWAALELGLKLRVPLPFAIPEYERDFTDQDSLVEFRHLLGRATAVEELPGRREEEDLAYEAVGRRVIELSHGLIAVWDGLPGRGRGGTAQIVSEALATGIPVLRVPSAGGATADPGNWAREVRARWRSGMDGKGTSSLP